MSELGFCSSYVLNECFQYIIHQACDKLVKSHLSRSGIFLELVQSYIYIYILPGAWGSEVVKALRYKSLGPGIDSKR